MSFLILDSQINFFKENGFIEFEDILSLEDLNKIEKEISIILNKIDSSEKIYNSIDLFRKSNILKKITLSTQLASIAANLSKKNLLKIGFDFALYPSIKDFFNKTIS